MSPPKYCGSFPIPLVPAAGLPTPHMPSADSRIHDKRPLRFAHSLLCLPSRPSLCVPPLERFGSSMVRSRYSTNAGNLVNRLSLFPVSQATATPRYSGPPGVSSGYFQRTIVRYTKFDHMTDRGLYPVLRTRPGLTSPRICLPSTFYSTGHTCPSTHAFAYGLLQPLLCSNRPCLRLSFASVRLDMDFDRYLCHNLGQHHLAAGPCPAHNKSVQRNGVIKPHRPLTSALYEKKIIKNNMII